MTRDQYESLPLLQLREIAKARGMKGMTALKKKDLIDRMIEKDEEEEREQSIARAEKAMQEREEKAAKAATQQAASSAGSQNDSSKQKKQSSGQSRSGNRTHRSENNRGENTRQRAQGGTGRMQGRQQPAAQTRQQQNAQTRQQTYTQPGMQQPDAEGQAGIRPAQPGPQEAPAAKPEPRNLDSGHEANGILEVMSDGYGFIRSDNYMPGENDIYVNPAMIRRYNLKTGDILCGNIKVKSQTEKFAALLYLKTMNGIRTEEAMRRPNFEDLTPIFPDERIHLERPGGSMAMRIVDLISPIGKGQRGMIVSPPKAGKTTLLKDVARSVTRNHPEMHLIILLIDERPEEVTDIKEAIEGPEVEVIHSTFDELPDHHRRVSEMTIERAKRLVEHGRDVIILLDSITRLARAYNLTVPPSGRTLSGGLDPAALHMPKKFFGAARNMREGGSLTILATALIETGSKMDDVIYEEFKGTGNMELVLNRKLQEKRVFPAIDIPKSGTRRDDLILTPEEFEAIEIIRKGLNGLKAEDAVENILNMFQRTRNNAEFVMMVKKMRYI